MLSGNGGVGNAHRVVGVAPDRKRLRDNRHANRLTVFVNVPVQDPCVLGLPGRWRLRDIPGGESGVVLG